MTTLKRFRWWGLAASVALLVFVLSLYANPNTPGTALWYGPDGGAMTLVNSTNPLPVTAPNSLQVIGAAGEGAVLSGNPVRIGLSDGTNLHTPQGDTSGRLFVTGPAAAASAAVGNPVQVGYTDSAGNIQVPRVNANKALILAGGNSDKATYYVSFNITAGNAAMDAVALESGTGKNCRLRRLVITNPGAQTAGGLRSLQLLRTTAAGNGSTVTPTPVDSSDAAFSGITRTGNAGANLGTAGTVLATIPIFVPSALASAQPMVFDFGGPGGALGKAPLIPVGTANGLSLRDPGAAGAANLAGYVEFTEE